MNDGEFAARKINVKKKETGAWDKEKSESPIGFEPMTPEHRPGTLSTELAESMESQVRFQPTLIYFNLN